MKIYLAGSYRSKEDREELRQIRAFLEEKGHSIYFPADSVDKEIGSFDENQHKKDFQDKVVEWEKDQIMSADMLIAVMNKPTIGTTMEIHFAHSNKKPVILFLTNEHDHILGSFWTHYHTDEIVRDKGELLNTLQNYGSDR